MDKDRVRFTVEWLVPVSQARSITLALQAVADAIRPAEGCLGCLVSTDFQSAAHVRYVEDWSNADELRQRAQARSFAPLARLIEDASRPPRIECTRDNGDDVRALTKELRDAARHYHEQQLADDRTERLHHRRRPAARIRAAQTH